MKTTWNLSLLYKSDNDPQIQKDIDISVENVETFVKNWKSNKEYTKDPKVLRKALDEYAELNDTSGICRKPGYYFSLRADQDQTNPDIKAQNNKISDIGTKLLNELQFFEINIGKIAKNKQKTFLDHRDLQIYKHFLERIFLLAKYDLSEKEERVFNIKGKTSHGNWVDMINELLDKQKLTVLDENLKEIEITYNETNKYLESQNKTVRDYAAKEFNKINTRYLEIAEFEMNSILENKKNNDEYRGFSKPELKRHIVDDIESEIVDTMVEVVTKNFDISKRYYKKRAELLGVKKLQYYERNIQSESIEKSYSFDQAFELVKKTFNSLDPLFAEILTSYAENGQYDVYPGTGKTGGAFCVSTGRTLPTFILLNHKNKLNDVLTIAHETGHGIHAELSKKQNILNSGHPISLAEIASTFFEDFVLEEVLKDTEDESFKKGIFYKRMHEDVSAIFRQVAFYNFEKELHHDFREKGFLTKEYISDLFCKHMKSYLGDSVEEDESMRNGWIYISHFRRFFYVYSYASGLLISKALQNMVRSDKTNIVLVKRFMASGSSMSPKELFQTLGIDISKQDIWERGIKSIEETLNKL